MSQSRDEEEEREREERKEEKQCGENRGYVKNKANG